MHFSQFIYAVVGILIGIHIQNVCCNPLEEKAIQKEKSTDELAKLRALLIKLAHQNELESFIEETLAQQQDDSSSASVSDSDFESSVVSSSDDESAADNDGNFDKRNSAYLRFGRSPAYLRFGRSGAYLRFGKRQPASYLRFGKRNPAYLRFGRSVE